MQTEQTEFQDQLVRGLTHRMNNILTLFHGYVGLMLDNESLDRNVREGLAKIKDGAQAASELMDRTHSLVRPSTVVWREIDLGEVVLALKSAINGFRGPNTKLEVEIEDDLPRVRADLSRLRTAILELVRNACEATAAGGTVRLRLHGEPPGHEAGSNHAVQPIHWVTLEIIDDGAGVAPELSERIFQPFFSTKRKRNATGLGLNVAQGLIAQLGGVLRYESRPGETRFQVQLPVSCDG